MIKTLIDFIPTKEYINNHFKNSLGRINLLKFDIIKDSFYHWCDTNLEYIYCVENDIKQEPICPVCHKNKCHFKSYAKGYKKYCSLHCTLISPEIKEKKKQTNIEKYGVEHSLQAQSVKDKSKQTHLEKYGVEHSSKCEISNQKRKQTNIEKHGSEYTFQSESIKEKIKEKIQTKYGVDNVSQNKEIQKKKEQTFLERCGETSNLKTKETQDKIKQTNLEKYGVDNKNQSHVLNYENYNKEFIEQNFVDNGNLNINSFLEYFNLSLSNGYKVLKRLDVIYEKTQSNKETTQQTLFNELKKRCQDHTNFIYLFKYNTYDIIKTKDGKKLELDIYIEVYENNNGNCGTLIKKIAIEYNGLMFHSFGTSIHSVFDNAHYENTLKRKHLEKTELCEEQGIHLFHVFENEWLDLKKREIWMSMFNNVLMLNSLKISARKCEIKNISHKVHNKEIKQFLEENHIQGNCPYTYAFGLYFNNKLVSLMTFGKSRYNKNYDYELLRFCSSINTNVIGAGSKLLSNFKREILKNNETLISYGNRRWTFSLQNFYKKNHFIEKEVSPINYYYFHNKDYSKLYHRSHFQKHKLEHYFNTNTYNITFFDKNKSERENMYANGFRKIYEPGQLVYIMENN